MIPLPHQEPDRAPRRRLHWGWAVAAGELVGLAIGTRLMQKDESDEAADEAVEVVEAGGETMPNRATAEAIAAELGLSLDRVDPVEAVQSEVVDVDRGLADSGLAALFDGLDEGGMEVLELAVAYDDPLAELAEFDVEDLAAMLVALES